MKPALLVTHLSSLLVAGNEQEPSRSTEQRREHADRAPFRFRLIILVAPFRLLWTAARLCHLSPFAFRKKASLRGCEIMGTANHAEFAAEVGPTAVRIAAGA